MIQPLKKSMYLCGVPTMWPVLLSLLFGGDCHGLNIAIDLILTSVNAMVSGDDFVDFIANLEKFYWLIGVTEEIKSPCNCRGFGWLGYHCPSPFPSSSLHQWTPLYWEQ